jgi:hypothetical protein
MVISNECLQLQNFVRIGVHAQTTLALILFDDYRSELDQLFADNSVQNANDWSWRLKVVPLGVDYTCVLDVQFGCAFHRRMRFQRHF